MSMQQSQQSQGQGQQTQQGRQNPEWARHKTVFSFMADTPNPEAFTQIAQRLQTEPGIRELTLLRDGPTPRVRVKVTPESLQTIQSVLSQVLQNVQQAYAGGGIYTGSSQF